MPWRTPTGPYRPKPGASAPEGRLRPRSTPEKAAASPPQRLDLVGAVLLVPAPLHADGMPVCANGAGAPSFMHSW